MAIQGSMLEALGINMYTSIGKCLVEFAANSHDSDATYVDITIPFDRVKAERARIRDAAKKKAKRAKEKVKIVLDPLPDDVAIVIRDDGHGMSANEIQKKYLPLNRNRRLRENSVEDPKLLMTESGMRRVMGRKGLGKLAAFGAALKVTIRSKRKGDTYADLHP